MIVRLTAVAVLAVILTSCVPSAKASPMPAADLAKYCQSYANNPDTPSKDQNEVANEIYCVAFTSGYILGIQNAIIKSPDGQPVVVNLSKGVTTQQAALCFLKFVKEHPEALNKDADDVLLSAMIHFKLFTFTQPENFQASSQLH